MANYDIRPLQLRLLRILTVIDKVCHEHNLRYYLVDGTLIGAVRHGGFIPWDDDIDIAMPREDYEALIRNCREWLPAPYELICHDTDPAHYTYFAKVQDASTTLIESPHIFYLGGIFVDIFPIDGVPESKLGRWFYSRRFKQLKKRLYFLLRDPYRHGHGPSCWWPLLMRKLYSIDSTQRKLRKHLSRYPFEKSRTIAVNTHCRLTSMFDREKVLGDPTPILFEGLEMQAMRDNDTYLRQVYGDYMTPPPPEQQRQHNFHYLDLDHPYREYKGEK